jgi:hypothetical protein
VAHRTHRRRWLPRSLRVLLALAACLAGYYALPYGRDGAVVSGTPGILIIAAGVLVVVSLLIRQVVNHIFEGGRDNDLESLLIAVCLGVIAFSLIYLKLESQFADLQTKTDALYFTVATLGTVGYGDVHAVGQGARAVVTVQMAIDLVYVAAVVTVATGLLRQRAETRVTGEAPPRG